MNTIVFGAFRIRERPDAPDSFQVTGPRLPGESRRTRKSFPTLDEAQKMAALWDRVVGKPKSGSPAGGMPSSRGFAHPTAQGGAADSATPIVGPAGGGAVPIVLNLPPLAPGNEMVVTIESATSVRVRVEPVLGYTLDEACERIPSRPHRDTLRAQLESSGIQIGAIGRTPLVSFQQLQQALKLGL